MEGSLLEDHSEADFVFPAHGILVEPLLRTDDQREYHDGVPRVHRIPHHEPPCPACYLHRWKQAGRSLGFQSLLFRRQLARLRRGQSFGERQTLLCLRLQSGIATCLGNQLDCLEHRSSSTDVRFWRLKRALEHALSLRSLLGRVWEVILSHCTFLGLQERGTLSTHLPPFIRNHDNSKPLWDSAREELFCFFKLDVRFVELVAPSSESHCHCL